MKIYLQGPPNIIRKTEKPVEMGEIIMFWVK